MARNLVGTLVERRENAEEWEWNREKGWWNSKKENEPERWNLEKSSLDRVRGLVSCKQLIIREL
jgi:hypothetical protein